MENYFSLKNYLISEGANSHTILYYQPLPIARYQIRFYANKYFDLLPIVSTAFKQLPIVSSAFNKAEMKPAALELKDRL